MRTLTTRQLRYQTNGLLGLLLFLIPSNLFVKCAENTGYVNGLLVDYLLPKFYLSDVVVLSLVCLGGVYQSQSWWKELKKHFQPWWVFVPLVSFLVARQFFSPYPLASFWFLSKVIMICLLMFSLSRLKKFISLGVVSACLAVTVVFQSVIGITQFVTQKSVAGFLFLGESNLNSLAGIAKATFNGAEKILPYGTTAHPNILAATLVIFTLLLLKLRQPTWWYIPTIGLSLITLYFTQSQAAWLALGLGSLLMATHHHLQKQVIKPLMIGVLFVIAISVLLSPSLNVVTPSWSWQRRISLNQAGLEYFYQQPIWGTGLNTNAALNEQVLAPQEITRFAQPAHHALILLLTEVGILGLVLVLWLGKKLTTEQLVWIVALSPMLFLDHYLLTLQTGQLLLGVSLMLLTVKPPVGRE